MKLEDFLAQLPPGNLWVFRLRLAHVVARVRLQAKARGRAYGYHRALCILSTRYRGTHRRPGLVVGLCRGGSCWGTAFLIDAARVRPTLARLWNRDAAPVYEPRLVLARLRGGRLVRALAFLADPGHPSYVRELDLHGRARLGRAGHRDSRPCVDYIQNTLAHMHQVGVRDPHLERVLHAALALREESDSMNLAGETSPPAARQPAARAAGEVLRRAAGRSRRAARRGRLAGAGRHRRLVIGRGAAAPSVLRAADAGRNALLAYARELEQIGAALRASPTPLFGAGRLRGEGSGRTPDRLRIA